MLKHFAKNFYKMLKIVKNCFTPIFYTRKVSYYFRIALDRKIRDKNCPYYD